MKQVTQIKNFSNKYTFSAFIRMGYSFLMTKLFWRRARIVTYPIFVHGKKKVKYGKGLSIGQCCRIDAINDDKITLFIGNNCNFGNFCHISAVHKVIIGDNFLCGDFVYIGDSSHGLYRSNELLEESSPDSLPSKRPLIGSEIKIGKNVWVGEKVSILPGVSIGDGSIIGANSVVTHDIEPMTISAGNPAVPIKKYDSNSKSWKRI